MRDVVGTRPAPRAGHDLTAQLGGSSGEAALAFRYGYVRPPEPPCESSSGEAALAFRYGYARPPEPQCGTPPAKGVPTPFHYHRRQIPTGGESPRLPLRWN